MSENSQDLKLGKIGQIAFHVSDLECAVMFYRDQLGLTFLFQVPNLAFFDCEGVRLMLSTIEEDINVSASIFYFYVDNIDAAYEALENRGVAFVRAPEFVANEGPRDLWMAFFHDMDQNLLAIMGYKPKSE